MMFNFYLTSVDLNGSQSDECGLLKKNILLFLILAYIYFKIQTITTWRFIFKY